jgi:hypothetical protein
MKYLSLILLMITLSHNAYSNCLTKHLDEAIEINHHRKVAYSLLSQNRSIPVSDALIQMENKMRKQLKFADFYASHWRQMGIGLLCDEVVEMNLIPSFQSTYKDTSPIKSLSITPTQWQKTIRNFVSKNDFHGLENWSHQLVLDLKAEPRTHCLTRHFVESIRRAAGLAPIHDRKAQELNISSTKWVSRQFILKQSELLIESQRIDQMAYPLQLQGLPIICQDVPYIPRAILQSSSHLSL